MSDLRKEDVVNRVLEHDRPGRSFVAVDGSRWGELILPARDEAGDRTEAGLRVLAVTSFFLGIEVLSALLDYERAHPKRLHLVAVATDDAINADAKIGLRKRMWKHYAQSERVAIEVATIETALQSGVPVYTGEFKIGWFYRQLASWRPDVIIVCACGQTPGSSSCRAMASTTFIHPISPTGMVRALNLTRTSWRATIPGRVGPCTE